MNHDTGRKRHRPRPAAVGPPRRGTRCSLPREDRAKRIVRRYYDEVLTGRRLDLLDRLVAPGFCGHDGAGGLMDLPGYRASAQMLHAAFPDPIVTVEDQLAERDRVSTRWWASGTHTGPFAGIPPSGRVVTISGMDIHRLDRGRIAELWEELDVASLLAQML
jgi:steroid delta-isomerase-like uncharacterized protein